MPQLPRELYRAIVQELPNEPGLLTEICRVSKAFCDKGQRKLFGTVEITVDITPFWPLRRLMLFHETILSSHRLALFVKTYSQVITVTDPGFSTNTLAKFLDLTFSVILTLKNLQALEFFFGTRSSLALAKPLADCGATFKLKRFSWSTNRACDSEEQDAAHMDRFLQGQPTVVDISIDLLSWRSSFTSAPGVTAVSGTADRIQALLPNRPVHTLHWMDCCSFDWSGLSSGLKNITRLSFAISCRYHSFPADLVSYMPHLALLEIRDALPQVSVDNTVC